MRCSLRIRAPIKANQGLACAKCRTREAKAVTAAAHKLARLIYAMLTKGQEYVDQGQQYYEERYRERAVRQLERRANKLGLLLVPATA